MHPRAVTPGIEGEWVIEQAIYGAQDADGDRFLARSPGFLDDWLPAAERLCTGFGERPAGVACPACVFAQPLGPRHVAVVQAADQGGDAERPGALAFRLLAVPLALYGEIGGDPFYIADQFPPDWRARGELPALEWTAAAPPERTVEALQKVLDVAHSATLLGGVQALLDGTRLVFERPAPDADLMRSLWALLPTSSRREMWPATFAFSNGGQFHALVVPRATAAEVVGYIDEQQAGDYPEGNYEWRLQSAVEHGDQQEMEALFARRSRRQMIRLAVGLLAVMVVIPPLVMLLPASPPAPPPAAKPAAAVEKLTLPAADLCPPLPDGERKQLAERLQRFAAARRIDLPLGTTDEALTGAVETIDRALPPAEPGRDPGPLPDLGPVQRQLRALLWKHGVAGYDAAGLDTVEMVEKLDEKVGPTRH